MLCDDVLRMNVPPLVSSAQMILAILFANAMAPTLAGLRANNAVSQGDSVAPRRACRSTAVAPTTRRERSVGFPILEIFPKRSFPPFACIFGVRPIHAAKCRPEVKTPGSGTSAWIVAAVIRPLMPLPPREPELNPQENIWQTVGSLLMRMWLALYATSEDCVGWAGAEPHAQRTSHATKYQGFCRS